MGKRKSLTRDFYFKAADDIYPFTPSEPVKPLTALSRYKFSKPDIFITPKPFDKNALPIAFRVLPEKLLEMTIKIVKKWPLPSVYDWNIEDICRWLRQLGYPQYQNTFRVNLVNGRTLLLLDAAALSAINIKDFDHIRHIAYNIRCLFHFELVKFARSISLPPENYFELYKLLRVKNGTKYDLFTQPVDLWRRMQLVRPPEALEDHWETLKRWLEFASDSKSKEIIAYKKRYNIYGCKKELETSEPEVVVNKPCGCMPPCECYWTERELRSSWKLDFINIRKKEDSVIPVSKLKVLSVLRQSFPERYKSTLLITHNS